MDIDKKLIKKAQAGDVEAFGELFKQTNKQIYNFLFYHSHDRELAEDLTQETFIRAFKSLKSLKSRNAFVSWLHRIALNLYKDELKKKNLDAESIDDNPSNNDDQEDNIPIEIEDWTNNPDKIIAEQELQTIVKDAIQSLPEIHRTVTIMHHIEGMEVEDIAKALKIKSGTVMSRLARARKSLRDKLASYVGEKYE